jgi:hypothetical protein
MPYVSVWSRAPRFGSPSRHPSLPRVVAAGPRAFLLGSTAYVIVPSLMVLLTLDLPPRVSRIANIALAVLYVTVTKAKYVRTARRIMEGNVFADSARVPWLGSAQSHHVPFAPLDEHAEASLHVEAALAS